MIWILLGLAAFADPGALPARPVAVELKPDQCADPLALRAGAALPAGLVLDGLVTCSVMLVPTPTLAHLVALESWGDDLAELHLIDTGELIRERDALRIELARIREPLPFWQRAETQRWVGRIESAALAGVGVGIGAAIARAQ